MNRSRERDLEEIPKNRINMYRFLESNRPLHTPSSRLRMRDNYMMNRLGSPMSRDHTIEFAGNQSVYSMEASPPKEQVAFDYLPPKSPTPPPPGYGVDMQHHQGRWEDNL
jgi:hypothetical protein